MSQKSTSDNSNFVIEIKIKPNKKKTVKRVITHNDDKHEDVLKEINHFIKDTKKELDVENNLNCVCCASVSCTDCFKNKIKVEGEDPKKCFCL